MDAEPVNVNAIIASRLALIALEEELPGLTDAEVRQGHEASEAESPKVDLYAGEMESGDLGS